MSKTGMIESDRRKTKYIKTKFDDKKQEKAINMLSYGVKISKVCKKGKFSHSCIFYILEDDPSFLQWISSKKSYIKSRINLSTVSSISDKPSWRLPGKLNKESNILCISFGDSVGDNFDLVMKFNDPETKSLFWQGVQYFILKYGKYGLERDNNEYLASKLFIQADIDGSKALDYKETKHLLQTLQIEINTKYLKKLFEKYDKDKSNSIEMKEFLQIINDITRKPEAINIFKQFCKEANNLDDEYAEIMTMSELEQFYKECQKEDFSLKDFAAKFSKIINSEATTKDKPPEKISFRNFGTLLFSQTENSIVNVAKTRIYQDMDRPLSDYYVNSSHNTYLLSNQLTGESSTKAYINAFKKGCRCIEIDCWDGDKGEPITYHGFTLTSKILFKDVIMTVKEYGFSLSEFPIIISLENHCSQKQQERMSQILKEELGQMLYILPENFSEFDYFPSPLDLKRRVIMKGKGLIFTNESSGERIGSGGAVKSQNSPVENNNFSSFANFFEPDEINNKPNHHNEDLITKSENEFAQVLKLADQEENEGIFTKNTLFEKYEKNNDPIKIKTLGYINARNMSLRSHSAELRSGKNISLSDKPLDSVDIRQISNEKTAVTHKPDFEDNLSPTVNLNFISPLSSDPAKELAPQQSIGPLVISQFQLLMSDEVLSDEDNSPKKGDQMMRHKERVSIQLKGCLSLFGIKLNLDQKRSIWNISSISEKKITRLLKEKETDLVNFHKTYLTRIYPSGRRIDSSNFDPMSSFMAGSQMIALNVQTVDLHLLIYLSRFLENGCERGGFVLKPSFMLTNCEKPLYPKDFTRPLIELSIEVISGQQLRPEKENDSRDVVDPYVEVFINGIPRDVAQNEMFRSQVLKNNGFNPQFNMKCSFKLNCPELVTLIFRVWDKDLMTNEKLGWFAVPFNIIREGYRVVPLFNSSLQKVEFSLLFCKISIMHL